MARFNLDDIMRTTQERGGCRVWTRAKSKDGYGQLWDPDKRKVLYTHRLVATIVYGEPLPGQEVLHSCDNPSCCEPQHLRWGSRRENVADMFTKGRNRHNPVQGEAHHSTPLTEQDVIDMRRERAAGLVLRELATKYGVSIAAVQKIVTQQTWKGVA